MTALCTVLPPGLLQNRTQRHCGSQKCTAASVLPLYRGARDQTGWLTRASALHFRIIDTKIVCWAKNLAQRRGSGQSPCLLLSSFLEQETHGSAFRSGSCMTRQGGPWNSRICGYGGRGTCTAATTWLSLYNMSRRSLRRACPSLCRADHQRLPAHRGGVSAGVHIVSGGWASSPSQVP
jgi:hypothetical protein